MQTTNKYQTYTPKSNCKVVDLTCPKDIEFILNQDELVYEIEPFECPNESYDYRGVFDRMEWFIGSKDFKSIIEVYPNDYGDWCERGWAPVSHDCYPCYHCFSSPDANLLKVSKEKDGSFSYKFFHCESDNVPDIFNGKKVNDHICGIDSDDYCYSD